MASGCCSDWSSTAFATANTTEAAAAPTTWTLRPMSNMVGCEGLDDDDGEDGGAGMKDGGAGVTVGRREWM